jgi:hypothetical protein
MVVFQQKGKRIGVGEVKHQGKVSYTFKCHLCQQKPLYGRKFRKHLVVEHGLKDHHAKRIVTGAARDHKRWREGGIS